MDLPEKLVREAAEAVRVADLGPALETARVLAGASGAFLYRFERAGRMTALAGGLSPLLADFGMASGPDDPLQEPGRKLPPGPRVVPASAMVDRATLRRSRAWAQFYRRHDLEHVACVWLNDRPSGSEGMVGLFLARSRVQGEFEIPALRSLAAVQWALETAVRRCSAVEQLLGAKPALLLPSGLTPAELRVLRMLELGASNRDIAAQLALSNDTVRGHLKNAYRKLGVRSRLEALLVLQRTASGAR